MLIDTIMIKLKMASIKIKKRQNSKERFIINDTEAWFSSFIKLVPQHQKEDKFQRS